MLKQRQRMDYFAQQLINGIVLGSIYGLIAIGYTMVYGIVGMINFAHGDIFMIGGFIALISLPDPGLARPHRGSGDPADRAAGLDGDHRALWLDRGAHRLPAAAALVPPRADAVGDRHVVRAVELFAGGAGRAGQAGAADHHRRLHAARSSNGFVVRLSNVQIVVVVTTIVLLAIFTWLVARTRLGRDMRACEQDQTMAALLGVDVDRTISMTFVIGAALAAVAGMMYLLYYGLVDFYMGFVAGIKAFTAAVLGGIGSLPGAMLGGLAIGLIETLWSAYFSVEYKDVAAFSILIIVLIFLPTGLLGRPEVEKV